MFQAMNQGWGNARIFVVIKSNSTFRIQPSWTKWWMHSIVKPWPSSNKWWWCNRCIGKNHNKKWGFRNGKCNNSLNRWESKLKLRDGRMRWKWTLHSIRQKSHFSNNKLTSSIAHLLCLKLWWMILTLVSRTLNFCISSKEYKKEKSLLKESRFVRRSQILKLWIRLGMRPNWFTSLIWLPSILPLRLPNKNKQNKH